MAAWGTDLVGVRFWSQVKGRGMGDAQVQVEQGSPKVKPVEARMRIGARVTGIMGNYQLAAAALLWGASLWPLERH